MQTFLLIIHVLLAVSLIGLILIQHGKGADAGAAFGSGASATVFGAGGASSFLTRLTTFLAIGFFANSLALAYFSAQQPESQSIVDQVQQQIEQVEDIPTTIVADPSAENASETVPEVNDAPADVPAQ